MLAYFLFLRVPLLNPNRTIPLSPPNKNNILISFVSLHPPTPSTSPNSCQHSAWPKHLLITRPSTVLTGCFEISGVLETKPVGPKMESEGPALDQESLRPMSIPDSLCNLWPGRSLTKYLGLDVPIYKVSTHFLPPFSQHTKGRVSISTLTLTSQERRARK